jgi:hypothetical protein
MASLLSTVEETRRLLDESLLAYVGQESGTLPKSILMFSGGRDSTLAALRMCKLGLAPVLVTVSSWHLTGIARVRQRVQEIDRCLTASVPWLVVRQPEDLRTDTSFYERTCLPCHHAYVIAGAAAAAKAGVNILGFGYAGYQASWPEQTPLAAKRLSSVLNRHGIELVLPVYDLDSRERAIEELTARGLSTEALEQKCIQQVTNLALDSGRLNEQIDLWERAIDISMAALATIEIEVTELRCNGLR